MKQNRTRMILALVLTMAAVLRLYGLEWDQGQHAHPDERWIAMVAPTITWPVRGADLLDPRRSTLNPLWVPDGQGGGQIRNFAYGHLPLYLHALVGQGLAALGEPLAQRGPAYVALAGKLRALGTYEGITVVGRLLSVLADLGTVYLVFLLGRRIYSERTALLASALVAVSVTHIQLAHFAAFDVITTFFVILSLYGSICVVQAPRRSIWPTIWGGAAAGMAVASKFSAMPLLAVLIAAQVIRAARQVSDEPHPIRATLRLSWVSVVLSLATAALAFLVTSPFAVLDWKSYLKQILDQGGMVRGTADWPFTRQYINTTPFLYQVIQQVRWGLGWVLGITAFAGFVWTVARQFRDPCAEELVLLGWAVPYLILTGTFMVKFMRYMLPLVPLFILMGSEMLVRISEWARARITDRRLRNAFYRVLSALPAIVLAAASLWALAFIRVYAQTHPWIQASRWIYANAPDGSVFAVEHWDDHLPQLLPEPGANLGTHGFRHVELPMYEPDTYDKLMLVHDRLGEADYVVLSTNRLYRTISRLPDRYPISSEFYRLLFGEQLGYVKETEFTAYPGLPGLSIRDDDADESFTVYDHPKPIVFRKERELSEGEWLELFGPALAKQPVWEPSKRGRLSLPAREPPQEGEEKRTLLLDRPVGELPVVDDYGWNGWTSRSTVAATVLWWLTVAVLGWLAWPLTFVVFRGLRDRGYLLSRAVALVVVGYLIWLPSSMRWLKNGVPLTYGAMAVLAAISALLLARYRAEMAAFFRERRGVVLIGEVLFGAAFLLFVGIRILNPDLWQPWQGGEKLMDIAYLNAVMRSAHLPPYDPYYAHGILNYYYYGQFLMSIPTRLTGLWTQVAFNLAVPTLFALTVCSAFSIGYSLAGRILDRATGERDRVGYGIAHGLFGALFVAVFGNLASATQIIERLGWVSPSEFTSKLPGLEAAVKGASGAWEILVNGARFPGFNYWDPSRVVGYTINEFPYWSFLFADLHPHMMNIPFTLLVIAFALNCLLRDRAPVRDGLPASEGATPVGELSLLRSSFRYLWRRLDWGMLLGWLVWALALGALWPTNSWDWPAYAGLSGLILLIVWVRRYGKQGIVPALLAALALAAGSLVLYWPFIRYYAAIYVGFGWSLARTHTVLGEFIEVWGFFLFLAITLLLILLARQRTRWACLRFLQLGVRYPAKLHRIERLCRAHVSLSGRAPRLCLAGASVLVLLVLAVAWKGYWVLVLMVPLLVLAITLLLQARMPRERRFVLALIFTAFLLLVGVELFYLKDHLDGDQVGWWRMNTLFKFYLQVWIMLGAALGPSLPGIWRATEAWSGVWRGLWTVALGLLLVAVSIFALVGTPVRVIDRFPGERPPIGTLDGMAFMTVGSYTWPDDTNRIPLIGDYEAIRWLQENVKGTPVQAEAPVGYYREFGGRVSSITGLPTVYNEQHEREQRWGWQNARRSAQVHDFFATNNPQRALDLADEMDIEYVYIGPLERTQYPQSMAKWQQLVDEGFLSIAYQNDLVTIYRLER